MTTKAKKLLYIVAAITGMTVFIGAAAIWTMQDGVTPFTLPSFVGLWVMIIFLGLAAATVYAFAFNGWFQNKLIGLKTKIEDAWR